MAAMRFSSLLRFEPNNPNGTVLMRIGCLQPDCVAETNLIQTNHAGNPSLIQFYTSKLRWFRQLLLQLSVSTLARVYAGDRANVKWNAATTILSISRQLFMERSLIVKPSDNVPTSLKTMSCSGSDETYGAQLPHAGVFTMDNPDHSEHLGLFVVRHYSTMCGSTPCYQAVTIDYKRREQMIANCTVNYNINSWSAPADSCFCCNSFSFIGYYVEDRKSEWIATKLIFLFFCTISVCRCTWFVSTNKWWSFKRNGTDKTATVALRSTEIVE